MTRRFPPPLPPRAEVEAKLSDLIAGRITPEDASVWASPWVMAEWPVEDEAFRDALECLHMADMPASMEGGYLYGREDFEAWLAEFRAKTGGSR